MNEWLSKLGRDQHVLDLGSGSGSFDYSQYVCPIVAVDKDFNLLSKVSAGRSGISAANSESHRLPFKDRAFSLVICNNTLEHFSQLRATLMEIGRILAPDGALIVTIPNGYGFDDGLYRFLLEGGGHVNRFRFEEIVRLIEELVSIRLIRWQELYSSYSYLRKPAPAVLPHLRPRFRRIARLPASVFRAAQFMLNIFIRFIGRFIGPEVALYGWALYFRRSSEPLTRTPATINVCMYCGSGHSAASLANRKLIRILYRCPSCNGLNPYFKPHGLTV
jgi:SAM-dependent methyltransferase